MNYYVLNESELKNGIILCYLRTQSKKESDDFISKKDDCVIYRGEFLPSKLILRGDKIIDVYNDMFVDNDSGDIDTNYYYIDKEYVIANGKPKLIASFDKKLKYPEYIVGKTYCLFCGKKLPQYVEIDSNDETIAKESTTEQLINRGYYEFKCGEYAEDGKLVVVPKPNKKYINYEWDNKEKKWVQTTKKEDLISLRADFIRMYSMSKRTIDDLEMFGNAEDEIAVEKKKMDQYKEEADNLYDIIRNMEG